MKIRLFKLLAIAVGSGLLAGCMTKGLWSDPEFIVPAPNPRLALFQTSKGIVVEYDAMYEESGRISRRAYYLEPNFDRTAKGKKPSFINLDKVGVAQIIPVFQQITTNAPDLATFAICSTNFCTFTVHRAGLLYGPCDLPVFKDVKRTAAQVALTPLTVTTDATVIGAVAAEYFAWLYTGGY